MLDPVGEQTSKNGSLMVYDFYPGWFYHVSFEKSQPIMMIRRINYNQ
jgi:hypothetical protein